jgi:DNA-binding NarL/FixJ family response regulator
MAGRYWIGTGPIANFGREGTGSVHRLAASGLTVRELDVVSVIVEGGSNKDIAQQFDISENTVKHHLTRIFDKLGVSSRLELAVRASARETVAG